jgi:hypothetical protein
MNYLGAFVALVLAILISVLAAIAIAGLIALLRGFIELQRLLAPISDTFTGLLLKSPAVPGVSAIYTPEDASPAARTRLRKLLDLHYGNHEAILVTNSEDLPTWTAEFHLVERDPGTYVSTDPIKLFVVVAPPASYAGRTNIGIKAARYPVLAFVDPEAEIIPEFLLLRMIRPMLEEPDTVVAVCATAPPDPAPGWAGAIGALEAFRVWLVRCAAFAAAQKLVPVPGSSFLIRRDIALEIGGVQSIPADLFPRIAAPRRAAFLPSAVSWLPAPQTWDDLRTRAQADQRTLTTMLPASREGKALYAVRVLRPILETVALILAAVGLAAGWIDWPIAALVVLSTAIMGIITSLTALVLKEFASPTADPATLRTLFAAAILENLGYRQLRNLWLLRS